MQSRGQMKHSGTGSFLGEIKDVVNSATGGGGTKEKELWIYGRNIISILSVLLTRGRKTWPGRPDSSTGMHNTYCRTRYTSIVKRYGIPSI